MVVFLWICFSVQTPFFARQEEDVGELVKVPVFARWRVGRETRKVHFLGRWILKIVGSHENGNGLLASRIQKMLDFGNSNPIGSMGMVYLLSLDLFFLVIFTGCNVPC